jgi:hypothetical protein
MNSPVVLCETGTPLIRATRRSIQGQTRRFCRVSYIGVTAAARKHRDARNVTNSQSDSSSLQTAAEIRRPHERNVSMYVGCPTDHHNGNVI